MQDTGFVYFIIYNQFIYVRYSTFFIYKTEDRDDFHYQITKSLIG